MTEHKLAALAVILLFISTMAVCSVDAAPPVLRDKSYCVDELDTCYIPWPMGFEWKGIAIYDTSGVHDTVSEYPLLSDGSRWEKLKAEIEWQNAHAQYKYLLHDLNEWNRLSAKKDPLDNGNSYIYDHFIAGTSLQKPYDFACEHPFLTAYAAAHAALDVKHIHTFFME